MSVMSADLEARFWANVDKADGCWTWLASTTSEGYGQIRADGINRSAHRLSWEMSQGPVPHGLVLDHLCRNRACVNPDHLEPVTQRVNVQRGERAQRTHCPRGHAYSPENTRVRAGKRNCVACHRINQSNYLARKKGDA